MNKLSASFLAMMLLMVIGACSAPDATITTTTTKTTTTTPTSTTQQTELGTTIESAHADGIIADGTYSEKASYRSPAQLENVEFSFTIKSGVVEDVALLSKSTVPNSNKFQGLFMEGIKKEIIGKKLSEIGTFDRVNGSSLTPKAFNRALDQLKQQA